MMLHRLRRVAAALLLGAVLGPLPGCEAPAKETPVVRYVGDDRFPMSKATTDGTYTLWDKDEMKDLWTVSLSAGDAIGFRREGKYIVAIAGNNEKVFPAGSYVWKR